jgi:hypothetical protein
MRPQNIGRALGIGVRIAGRIAGRRIMGTARPAASAPHVNGQSIASANRVAQVQSQARAGASIAAQTSRGLSKGIGGFLRPFRRVGGIVWLEVTGTFFLLFAALFAFFETNGIATDRRAAHHQDQRASTKAPDAFP